MHLTGGDAPLFVLATPFMLARPNWAAGSFTLPEKLAAGHRPMAFRAQADVEEGEILFSGRMNFYTRFSCYYFCVGLAAQVSFFILLLHVPFSHSFNLSCFFFVLFFFFFMLCDNEWQTLYHHLGF